MHIMCALRGGSVWVEGVVWRDGGGGGGVVMVWHDGGGVWHYSGGPPPSPLPLHPKIHTNVVISPLVAASWAMATLVTLVPIWAGSTRTNLDWVLCPPPPPPPPPPTGGPCIPWGPPKGSRGEWWAGPPLG